MPMLPAVTRSPVRLLLVSALTLWATTGCSGGSDTPVTPPVTPPAVVVTRVEITPGAGTIDVGASLTLQAQPFSAAGAALTGRTVSWRSEAPQIATVTDQGVVTGIAAGTAPVVATVSGVSVTTSISVRDVNRIDADSVRLTDVGQLADLRISRNGQPSTVATVTLIDEQRWLSELPVLEAAALGQGRVVSTGPGRARVRVQAGTLIDTVTIGVTLARARIFSSSAPVGRTHLGSADTITLRGYALTSLAVAALQANGFTPTTTARDSATWRFVFPPAADACTGNPPAITLTLTSSDGVLPSGLTRAFANELSLAVGDARRLTSAQAECLRFAPSSQARYLLSYADSRLHEKAKTQPEYPWPDSVVVRVTPAGRSAATPLRALARNALLFDGPESALRSAAASAVAPAAASMVPAGCPYLNASAPFCRATPYVLGEVFTHYPFDRPSGPARVIAIRGNLVLAVFRADSSLLAPNAVARADSALRLFATTGIPWLQSVYSLSAPTSSSDESGQLLLMLDASTQSSAGWFADGGQGHGRWGRLTLGMPDGSGFRVDGYSYSLNYSIIAHEVTHTYQYRWRWQYAAPWQTYLGTSWGVEGGATFAQLQTLRETLGVSFSANTNFDVLPLTDPASSLSVGARARGDVTAGYTPAASMLRDFMQRLAQSGMTTRDAAREVAQGAMEGWHGINEEGLARGLGLTARMRARLGAAWNPTDAMLQWTMTEAADDMTSNPLYQNVSNRKSSTTTADASLPPHALVQPTVAAAVLRAAGNSGVFEISDPLGTAFRADAVVGTMATTAVQWLVLRIR
ncbi:Ig-like domain-containing protein [Gemmatimonas groenlandica]|uniref:Ig-like domain-containing protein n=1 Tax=Gemmatimonas groenlandica TaxID=2732249 RepID=A0A6M4ISL0_9BACT|nr:Ig-like domain-containing protein [Gemmatimonas groenlandica]QJR37640.1 Ig-like domain-containing protein [Gemmatimonas groenlandica]